MPFRYNGEPRSLSGIRIHTLGSFFVRLYVPELPPSKLWLPGEGVTCRYNTCDKIEYGTIVATFNKKGKFGSSEGEGDDYGFAAFYLKEDGFGTHVLGVNSKRGKGGKGGVVEAMTVPSSNYSSTYDSFRSYSLQHELPSRILRDLRVVEITYPFKSREYDWSWSSVKFDDDW